MTAVLTVSDPCAVEATPEQLASACRDGRSDAFEPLLKLYAPRVFGFLLRMTGNRQDAEDLTQETFVRVYRSIERFDPSYAFSPWVFAIARKTAASHFRKRRPTEPLVDDPVADTAVDPAVEAEKEDQATRLWELARGLKPSCFQVLWLHYAEGFSVEHTAHIMNLTQVHVKVMLHRARAQLARRLEANHD